MLFDKDKTPKKLSLDLDKAIEFIPHGNREYQVLIFGILVDLYHGELKESKEAVISAELDQAKLKEYIEIRDFLEAKVIPLVPEKNQYYSLSGTTKQNTLAIETPSGAYSVLFDYKTGQFSFANQQHDSLRDLIVLLVEKSPGEIHRRSRRKE